MRPFAYGLAAMLAVLAVGAPIVWNAHRNPADPSDGQQGGSEPAQVQTASPSLSLEEPEELATTEDVQSLDLLYRDLETFRLESDSKSEEDFQLEYLDRRVARLGLGKEDGERFLRNVEGALARLDAGQRALGRASAEALRLENESAAAKLRSQAQSRWLAAQDEAVHGLLEGIEMTPRLRLFAEDQRDWLNRCRFAAQRVRSE